MLSWLAYYETKVSCDKDNQKMKKERPQKGNPYGLTINQHIFPAASIKRFSGVKGNVEVKRVGAKQSFTAKSDNKIFCGEFVWDHGSESGFMKNIEDRFQNLVGSFINDCRERFSSDENKIVTEMYALCCVRFMRKRTPILGQKLNGVKPENLTIDEQEILEKKGCSYVDSNSIVSSRQMTGMQIRFDIDRICKQMTNVNWGVLSAEIGEFIVPDNFTKHAYFPLNPTMVLAANQTNRSIGFEEVERINRNAIESSDTYFFARELSACPLLKPLFVFTQNELFK